MTQTVETRIARVVSDVMGVPAEQVKDTSSPDTIANWDSLSHLNLVIAMEAEFGVELSAEDAIEMLSVGLIRIILEERGAS